MRSAKVIKYLSDEACDQAEQVLGSAWGNVRIDEYGLTPINDITEQQVSLLSAILTVDLSDQNMNGCSICGCYNVYPHTDEVRFDVTFGYVLSGDHILYTGNGRPVGELRRGCVYVLENKRQHGARQRVPDAEPLVFVTVDICAERVKDVERLFL